jgi:hypothetical protein
LRVSRSYVSDRFIQSPHPGSQITSIVMTIPDERKLSDLRGIGRKMLEDFEQLGISTVRQLRAQDACHMYVRMCEISGTRQDHCVLDTYRCAIEQARNPRLPEEQRDWWYWSRLRKVGLVTQKAD